MSDPSQKQAVLTCIPINSSFNSKRTITLNDKQNIDIGRLIEGSEFSNNLKFASKVVSRAHARILFAEGKIFVQDTRSSSGTFLNGSRLSPQGQMSDYVEMKDEDTLQLGENYNLNGIFIPCIMMKVNITVFDSNENNGEADYVDMSQDPQVRANVDAEFNTVWKHLTSNMKPPLERLREFNKRFSSGTVTPHRTTMVINRSHSLSGGFHATLEPMPEQQS